MKRLRKWLAVGLTTAAVCLGSLMGTVTASAAGYERWATVAEEERVQAGYAKDTEKDKDEDKDEKPEKVHPNAWKKINGICYNGSGEEIPGAITRGIDVSEWQGKINWYKVKEAGVDFAFVRISYGLGHLDKTYDYNMEQAELAGVPVGTYVYSTATTTEGALKEAQLAIDKMKGHQVSYPVVFDLEYANMGALSKKQVSKLALTFCTEVEKAGYYPMVYCNTNWYDYEIDWSLISDYDVWIARYGDKIQAPSHSKYKYTIWQSTDGDGGGVLNPTKGLIPGIPLDCNVDMDFGYVDYTKKIVPRRSPVYDYEPSKKPIVEDEINPDEVKNGWAEENGKKYYYVNGKKAKGWKKIDGKTYYFHQTKCYMYKNKRTINSAGDIYYFGSDGARYENGLRRIRINGEIKTLYFRTNGKAHKGWLILNGKKYYFYNGKALVSGTRAENITLISSNKIVSVFDKNGVCIKQYKQKA